MQNIHNLKGKIALITFVAFMTIGIFMLNVPSMAQMDNGITSCPYTMGEESMCPMNFVDHLAYWKQIFTANSAPITKLATILLFVPLLFSVLRKIFILYFPKIKNLRRFENYYKESDLFNWLLFTIGKILQPRLYAPATISA